LPIVLGAAFIGSSPLEVNFMQSNVSRIVRALSPALTFLAVSLIATSANAQQVTTPDANDMTGSWLISLNRVLPFPVQALALGTFNKEGTFIGTAQGDGAFLPQVGTEGAAHGAWRRTGHNTFALTFMTLWFMPDASLSGIMTVNLMLTLDPKADRVSGQFSGQLVGPSGNVIFPLQGSLTGQRIRVQ
jgi:hypothetical protein